ncbi:hypothetical protein B0T14DRAFT_263653 [Immersiella caudata]|uniref:Uncharacterized protein n=1 Tax=Immersiella caudata TaxID=314043 RepID=A0AA39WKU3_9PEZI|nr:hypothetical protein B0T14DRAFT_263653 [Immersiella caudata]
MDCWRPKQTTSCGAHELMRSPRAHAAARLSPCELLTAAVRCCPLPAPGSMPVISWRLRGCQLRALLRGERVLNFQPAVGARKISTQNNSDIKINSCIIISRLDNDAEAQFFA